MPSVDHTKLSDSEGARGSLLDPLTSAIVGKVVGRWDRVGIGVSRWHSRMGRGWILAAMVPAKSDPLGSAKTCKSESAGADPCRPIGDYGMAE